MGQDTELVKFSWWPDLHGRHVHQEQDMSDYRCDRGQIPSSPSAKLKAYLILSSIPSLCRYRPRGLRHRQAFLELARWLEAGFQ